MKILAVLIFFALFLPAVTASLLLEQAKSIFIQEIIMYNKLLKSGNLKVMEPLDTKFSFRIVGHQFNEFDFIIESENPLYNDYVERYLRKKDSNLSKEFIANITY